MDLAVIPGGKLSAAEAAVMETFAVPRYLSLLGDLALDMLLAGEGARVVHLGCRTGYPDRHLCEKVDGCTVVGVDPSLPALELARNKAAIRASADLQYLVATDYPTELDADTFSHALSLHPLGGAPERSKLFTEMFRLLYAGGQALVAIPLRGSFQEIADLFREYSLKFDEGSFGQATDTAASERPTLESLSEELESAGFDDVDVEIRQTSLTFDSGRAFAEDPVTRLLIVPDLAATMGVDDLGRPLGYLRDAIDKYWSEAKFELTLNVGCASARKS